LRRHFFWVSALAMIRLLLLVEQDY
jgi:hypothetical protein